MSEFLNPKRFLTATAIALGLTACAGSPSKAPQPRDLHLEVTHEFTPNGMRITHYGSVEISASVPFTPPDRIDYCDGTDLVSAQSDEADQRQQNHKACEDGKLVADEFKLK